MTTQRKGKAAVRHRKAMATRNKIRRYSRRPRLSVFRSVAHIYVQVIDDRSGTTIASASSVEPTIKAALADGAKGGNSKGAEAIGKAIAERLKAKGITKVVFDRNGYIYHGRVRALADGARKGGLEF